MSSNVPDDLWSLLPLGKCLCFPQGAHGENNPKETSILCPFFRVWFVNSRMVFRDRGEEMAL